MIQYRLLSSIACYFKSKRAQQQRARQRFHRPLNFHRPRQFQQSLQWRRFNLHRTYHFEVGASLRPCWNWTLLVIPTIRGRCAEKRERVQDKGPKSVAAEPSFLAFAVQWLRARRAPLILKSTRVYALSVWKSFAQRNSRWNFPFAVYHAVKVSFLFALWPERQNNRIVGLKI